MPGEVVSLFCYGTGTGSADNSGNIIDILHRMCKGRKLVLEGPGSEDFHRITGDERQQLPDDIKKDIGIWNKKFPRMRKIMLWEGIITGHGMGSNTGRAYLYLKNLQEGGVEIDTVNLIGWSRGGITCFRIAHYINKYFLPKPDVNIFAIDPVEGENLKAVWGWGKADRRNIPNIVKNLIVTLALDEKSENFVPSDHQRLVIPGGVNYCFLPFPGRHLTQCYRWLYDYELKLINEKYEGTGAGTTNEDVLLGVSKIVWHLAYKFLLKQGTQFELIRKNSYQYKAHNKLVNVSVRDLFSLGDDSDMWRLNCYNSIHNNMDFFEHILRTKSTNTWRVGHTKTLKFHRRKIKKGRIWEIVKHPNLFVNDHHMHVHKGDTGRDSSLEPSRRINMKDDKSFGISPGTIYHIRQGKYNDAHVINWGDLY